jgi:hypothetical protein
MLILFDNGTPAPPRHELKNHMVVEAIERGWDRLANGALIAAAEAAGFEVLLTTDKNLRYQQNIKDRKIAFVVLGNQHEPGNQQPRQAAVRQAARTAERDRNAT